MSQYTLSDALDEALALRDQGHPLEYCVQQFPEYADKLWPLLQLSDDLRSLAHASTVSCAQVRGEPDWEKLLADIPQHHPGRGHAVATSVAARSRAWYRLSAPRHAILAVTCLFLIVSGWTMLRTDLQMARATRNLQVIQQTLSPVQEALNTTQQNSDYEQFHPQLVSLAQDLEDTERVINQLKGASFAPGLASFEHAETQIEQLYSDLQEMTEEILVSTDM